MTETAPPRGWRRRLRLPLTLLGAAIFVTGLVWAVRVLGLRPADLAPLPALLILLVLSPANTAVAARTLQITGRAVGTALPFGAAFDICAIGALSELLPLPGGAIVRGAGLVRHGAAAAATTVMITLTSVLTLAMTSALAGLALAGFGRPALGAAVAAVAAAGLAITGALIARRAGLRALAAMLAIRLATIALTVLRLTAAFAALHLSAGLAEAALLTVSGTLGSAVAIVPAGFGINEAIAGAIAAIAAVSPAAAFLAVALNRVLGLAGNALIVLRPRRTGRRGR